MADIVSELGAFLKEVEADAAVIEGDVVGALRAAYNAFRYGDVASAMAAVAAVVQEAKNIAAILEKDAAALVPANVKAFVNDGQTLNTILPVPVLGNVVGIFWRGNDVQSLIDAIAAGKTQSAEEATHVRRPRGVVVHFAPESDYPEPHALMVNDPYGPPPFHFPGTIITIPIEVHLR